MSDYLSIPHPVESLVLSKVDAKTRSRARQVRLAVFDVDGVLTDGSLYYGEQGEKLKCFNSLDGHGLRMLEQSGIHVALITGRESTILMRRAAELGISVLKQNIRNKVIELQELTQSLQLDLSQVSFMGDDVIDLPAMAKVGFSISVPNAPSYVQQAAHWVTQAYGGHGAVRQAIDVILASQGLLHNFLTNKNHPIQGAVIQ